MNRNCRRDEGFSLVELVIVVLVMAIIAAALAPQVTKWVNNSRISTDVQTRDMVVSCANYSVSNPSAYADTNGKQIRFYIDNTGCVVNVPSIDSGASTGIGNFVEAFSGYSNMEYTASGDSYTFSKIKTKTSGGVITVDITKGAVTSSLNSVLSSEDLEISGSAVVDINPVWNSFSNSYTGGTGGSTSWYTGAGAPSDPSVGIHATNNLVAVGGSNYLNDILIVAEPDDLSSVKIDGEIPPIWVYVGLDKAEAGDYSEVVLFKWSGEKDEEGNPIWKKQLLNGL